MPENKKRRRNKDPLLKIIAWMNGATVIFLFAAICVLALAKPESKNFFDHFFDVNVHRRARWDTTLIDYIALLLLFSFLTSVVGLLVNTLRLRRKSDYIRATLVLCLVLSITGLGIYAFHH